MCLLFKISIALPIHVKVRHFFHVSLLKRYIHYNSHVIYWNLIQVEPEGYFLSEPLCILDQKETVLQNQVVAQVKVQWRHFTPD